jgi:hypothetical protein
VNITVVRTRSAAGAMLGRGTSSTISDLMREGSTPAVNGQPKAR